MQHLVWKDLILQGTSGPLDHWKDIAAIAGAVLAVLTLGKATLEYVLQGKLKRAELYFQRAKEWDTDPRVQRIQALLGDDDPELREIPYSDKEFFLGAIEEVALLHNSRLMSTSVAHYMFGYYALRCDESNNFWGRDNDGVGVERQSIYWREFNSFVKTMRAFEEKTGKKHIVPRF